MADHSHVTEQQARDAVVAALANHDELDLVEQGQFLPGREGEYAAVWIIAHRENAPFGPSRSYSTHRAIIQDDVLKTFEDSLPRVSFDRGTYDLTLDEAAHRLPR